MKNNKLDYSATFSQLTQSLDNTEINFSFDNELADWYNNWRQRIGASASDISAAKVLMTSHNPVVIPRNHHVEQVLANCEQTGSPQAAEDLLAVLRSPYQQLPETSNYQDLPADGDQFYRTFCGT